MPEFWLDTDSLIRPSREAYRFDILPQFWEFLEQHARDQMIASSEFVLAELVGSGDELERWALRQQGTLFLSPDQAVQKTFGMVAESVNNNRRYAPQHVADFLAHADPWIIAHAKAHGGRVVTFEVSAAASTKPKIPDVAAPFGVRCINLWDMLTELHPTF